MSEMLKNVIMLQMRGNNLEQASFFFFSEKS